MEIENIEKQLTEFCQSFIRVIQEQAKESEKSQTKEVNRGQDIFLAEVFPEFLEKLPTFCLESAKQGKSQEEIVKAARVAISAARETCISYFG